MGFLDKAKEAAEKAAAGARQAAQQGQAKVGAYQQSRSEAELFKTLGEAVFHEQRSGGDPAAVASALSALDAHFAAVAAAAAAAPPAPAAQPYVAPANGAPTASPSGPSAPSASTTAPAGNFTLDDM